MRRGSMTPGFVSSNRGKRSIVLNLKQPETLSVLHRLIAVSDVLVQNFRPGVADRLGFGEPTARAINPGLIYVSISGVGETGPYVRKRVYDPVIQALSGLADIQRDTETGRPRMVRTLIADKTTALAAAQAICAALYNKAVRVEGQHVRLAMLDVMVAYLWPEGFQDLTLVEQADPGTRPASSPDLIFRTADGYITAGALSDAEWRSMCAGTGPAGVDRRPSVSHGRSAVGECGGAPGVGGRGPRDQGQRGLADPIGRGGGAVRAGY